MASRVPEELIETIRQRTSILELVSSHVSLKKSGRNYLGLCPFHAEKTPSFTVNEERGFFHCFGCGAGGSAFNFLMRIDKLDFREAVEQLAKRAGIVIPRSVSDGPGAEQRNALVAANQTAQEYFVAALRSARGGMARAYLEKRGVASNIIAQYGLGFCPREGGLSRALSSAKIPSQAAVQLGLLGQRSDGSFYDRFWGRIIFPIRDSGGRIVGFGGRAIGDQQPKYLNSPESALFHKGEVLYGLYEARQSIRGAERIVLVEGYLDALALVQADIPYVVASLGTALGPAQLRLAGRFAAEIIAFFDGDAAGLKAAARAFSVCAETNVWGLGAFLPQGYDPDTYVRELGAAATLALLQHAIPLADFYLQTVDPGPNATVPQKVKAAAQVGEVLAKIQDVAQFSVLAKRAAQTLGVSEDAFRQRRVRPAPPGGTAPPTQSEARMEAESNFRAEEITLVEAMALDPKVAQLVEEQGVIARFSSPELGEAGGAIRDAWSTRRPIEGLLDQLPPAVSARVRAGLLGNGAVATGNPMQIAADCIRRLEERDHRARLRALRCQVQQAEASGNDAPLEDLRDQLRQRN